MFIRWQHLPSKKKKKNERHKLIVPVVICFSNQHNTINKPSLTFLYSFKQSLATMKSKNQFLFKLLTHIGLVQINKQRPPSVKFTEDNDGALDGELYWNSTKSQKIVFNLKTWTLNVVLCNMKKHHSWMV